LQPGSQAQRGGGAALPESDCARWCDSRGTLAGLGWIPVFSSR